ncbi:hypothetical protein Rs2_09985 [Raphanus sativus]|nr:hypothetical protein Rs2_09985 [Raphanus sativus]
MKAISNPYSREEIDEILTKAHITQIDSLNYFKWRIDSVYHSLNQKITWLTKNMEFLADDIKSIIQRQTRETPARNYMPSTSTDDRWIPSTDADYPRLIDRNFEQLDSRRKIFPSIDTPTRISIPFPQEEATKYHQSIDIITALPIDERKPALFKALKREINKIIATNNQWDAESLQKKLDVFYCSIHGNMDWISKRGELMQNEFGFSTQQAEDVKNRSTQEKSHRSIAAPTKMNGIQNSITNQSMDLEPMRDRSKAGQIHQKIQPHKEEKLHTLKKKLTR